MKHTILILGLFFLASCGNEEASKQVTKENKVDTIIVSQEIPKIDTLDSVNIPGDNVPVDYASLLKSPLHYFPEEITVLKQYFNDSLIVELDSNQFALQDASTDTTLLNAFEENLALRNLMVDQLMNLNLPDQKGDDYYPDYLITDLKPIDEASLGLSSTCVAECTEFDFTFSLVDFKERAKQTTGTLDDEFFDLLILGDGEFGGTASGWFNWFERTWDYGGGSLIGSGIHLEFLQKAATFQKKTSQFDFHLAIYKEDLLRDIKHGIYMYSRDQITAEVKDILSLPSLSEEEKKSLTEFLQLLESDETACKNCVDGILQFDCNTGDCNWGG